MYLSERKGSKMMKAEKAYEIAATVVEESDDWKYLEERITWHANAGHVQMCASFDHNPQTALHMLRELGYKVTPQTIDADAKYFSFTISWF